MTSEVGSDVRGCGSKTDRRSLWPRGLASARGSPRKFWRRGRKFVRRREKQGRRASKTAKGLWKRRHRLQETFWLVVLALITRREDPRNFLLRADYEHELKRLEARFPLRVLTRRKRPPA